MGYVHLKLVQLLLEKQLPVGITILIQAPLIQMFLHQEEKWEGITIRVMAHM